MSAGGYESWFISAGDPVSPRALWIRHTRHRRVNGQESAALWCTVIDRHAGQPPTVVKQVFAAFPPDAAAGPQKFRGQATLGLHEARWDLAVTGAQPPLRPLRPAALYRAPLPRTKLEASVPDGLVTGTLEIGGRTVAVSGWRGTVGHNWGFEHADSRLQLSVTTDEQDLVAVLYADPRGGTRTVRHAALASVEVVVRRPGDHELILSSSHGAYEYGTRQDMPQIVPQPLPEG